jgi:ribosome-associated protein
VPRTKAAETARRIVDVLADRQAEDTVLLDVRDVASFADYFIIATATNPRHMRALVGTLQRELRGDNIRATHQEGVEEGGWILLDYGDVIVHLFSAEMRSLYSLEELWNAAREVVRMQ